MLDPFTVPTGFLGYPALQTLIVPEKTLPWPVDETTLFPQSIKHVIITDSEDYAPHIVARINEHQKHGGFLNLPSIDVYCSTEEQRIHDPLTPQETDLGLSVALHFSTYILVIVSTILIISQLIYLLILKDLRVDIYTNYTS
jgi:hypothetical protein